MDKGGLEGKIKHDRSSKIDRVKKILGLILISLSVFLFISFTNYLYTWKVDMSEAEDMVIDSKGDLILTIDEVKYVIQGNNIENNDRVFIFKDYKSKSIGKIPIILSNFFIYKCFGIGSYLLLILLFVGGVKMFMGIELINMMKLFYHLLYLIPLISLTLGFLLMPQFLGISPDNLIYAGAFGYYLAYLLTEYLGEYGLVILLVILYISYFIFNSIKFKWLQSVPLTLKKDLSKSDSVVNNNKIGDIPNDDIKNKDFNKKEGKENNSNIPPLEITRTRDDINKKSDVVYERDVIVNPLQEKKTGEIDPLIDGIKIKSVSESNNEKKEELEPYDPVSELPDYKMPKLELLKDYDNAKTSVSDEELEQNSRDIISTLSNYKISIDKISATVGPTVTLYEIVPSKGIRISQIRNLEDDIALGLSALRIRIIAPMPGKGTIGIEVPRKNPEIVPIKELLMSDKFINSQLELPVILGKTITNDIYIADLTKMPHLLMAGATGQGKSVGLNVILVSLLYKKHPSLVKFVLVDPKKVELALYNKIEKHYLAALPGLDEAIITDTKNVVSALKALCNEMDARYNLLKMSSVKNIKEYNQKYNKGLLKRSEGHRFLPYIILVVDEFADLIMTAGKEVEVPIARLAQLARAIGIHIIIATQRPSVNIITGTIKANFPTRIAFRVTSKVDSRTILDSNGAEQLIGNGDMLLSTGSDMIRLQCPFVGTNEIESIAEYIGSQNGFESTFKLPEVHDENEGDSEDNNLPDDRDVLFEEAARLLVASQQGSVSILQRKLQIGFNRAGRIIDQLEQVGIVGPNEGSKPREVKFKTLDELENYLKKLKN